MEFSPFNNIVKLCLQGAALDAQGQPEAAGTIFQQAWNEAHSDMERFLTAYFTAKHQNNDAEKIKWLKTALQFAEAAEDIGVKSAVPTVYRTIADCYEVTDPVQAKKYNELAASFQNKIADGGPFFHGTKADLKTGDLLLPGNKSNYQEELVMNHIYFTAMPNGAGLAASLAKGDGRERVYVVQPTGEFENDPNVTDKRFPGNMTRSYRTSSPLKIVGEIADWSKQTEEDIRKWKEKLANNKGDIIN